MYTEFNSLDRNPHHLSPEEIEHPALMMHQLFDYASLPSIRTLLWIWLRATVTNGYAKCLDFREKERIFTLYEKIVKLVEANHLLYEQQREQLIQLENQLRFKTEENT